MPRPDSVRRRTTGTCCALLAAALIALAPGLVVAQEHRHGHSHGHGERHGQGHTAPSSDTPYAGMEQRAIKALSAEEMAELRAGAGMGLALAAELNGYPGPAHVLDLAEQLEIDDDQRRRVEATHARMSATARALGGAIIDVEAALDRSFASGSASKDSVVQVTRELGRLQGELRAAHLVAHVETRAVLNEEQIARYAQLRGYASP